MYLLLTTYGRFLRKKKSGNTPDSAFKINAVLIYNGHKLNVNSTRYVFYPHFTTPTLKAQLKVHILITAIKLCPLRIS